MRSPCCRISERGVEEPEPARQILLDRELVLELGFQLHLLGVVAFLVLAGDAVAVGYNADGVWTGVTYFCSSKPKGGKDYKTENGAREEAMRDLRKRSSYTASTVKILSSSDSTGFVAVARGKDKSGKDLNVVDFSRP